MHGAVDYWCPSHQCRLLCPSHQCRLLCPSHQCRLLCPSHQCRLLCPSHQCRLLCPSHQCTLLVSQPPMEIIGVPATNVHYWRPSHQCTLLVSQPPMYIIGVPATNVHYWCPSHQCTLLVSQPAHQVCKCFKRHYRIHWCMVEFAFLFSWNSVEIYLKTGIAINVFNNERSDRQDTPSNYFVHGVV